MQCKYILGITVMKSTADEELDASHKALEKKYRSHQGFVGLRRFLHDVEALVHDISGFEHMIGKDGVGLYWEVHANQVETQPSIETLASITVALFKLGIRFRKINLSGCFTAGMDEGGGSGAAVDFSSSMQAKFCRLLAEAVGHTELEGCMVCGYRSIIILYDSQSPYFTKQEHAKEKFKALQPGVQNTVSRSGSGGSLQPTHPKGVAFEQFEDYMEQRAKSIKAFVKHKPEFIQDGSGFISHRKLENQLASQPMHGVYSAVCNYVRLKRAMKFTNHQWSACSLAQWTDNQTIQQLVSEVEYFNRVESARYLSSAGCRVKLVP